MRSRRFAVDAGRTLPRPAARSKRARRATLLCSPSFTDDYPDAYGADGAARQLPPDRHGDQRGAARPHRVAVALLTTNTPMGFIAILGIIALAGMIIRNSVILVDQIEHERARGIEPWTAAIDATTHRFRPIMLTAAAAILGMIPIMHDVFWGPMAYAMVGGLAVATVLTLVFLPALYVAVNGIREEGETTAAPDVPAIPLGSTALTNRNGRARKQSLVDA